MVVNISPGHTLRLASPPMGQKPRAASVDTRGVWEASGTPTRGARRSIITQAEAPGVAVTQTPSWAGFSGK